MGGKSKVTFKYSLVALLTLSFALSGCGGATTRMLLQLTKQRRQQQRILLQLTREERLNRSRLAHLSG